VSYLNRLARSGLLLLTMMAALTACTAAGDVSISNESSTDVIVSTGDDEVELRTAEGSRGVSVEPAP